MFTAKTEFVVFMAKGITAARIKDSISGVGQNSVTGQN
jgi:hypothetical protein